MEAQLLPVAEVPLGVVTSTYLGGERAAAQEEGSPSEILVALCPTGRMLAFITSSYKAQFLFLEGGPLQDSGGVASYRNSFEGLLDVPRDPDSQQPRPKATAAVIIPIAFETQSGSVQRSSIVMVGFSDGYVRGYSKLGQRVFSRLMHLEPVTKLTCMAASTVQKPTSSLNNLVVLYRGCTVCVVEGWSIVEVIKVNVTNINAGGGDRKEGEGEGGTTPLKYKKWNLKDQTLTNDVALLAHTTPSSFDHLCEASNVAGFDATIRSSPVPEAKLITVGETPMIALYKITKDAGHINMSEVMQVMASKMTSAVLGRLSKAGGWLGWGGGAPKPKPPEEKIEISSNLPMSTNIPDGRRSVLSVSVSPLGNLAAAVDCFGRVLLLDCETLVIRRMWKGYRDAQCGWSLVYDTTADSAERRKISKVGKRQAPSGSTSSKSGKASTSQDLALKKKAQCLCIYAPRRGILELWPVQSGSRVAALPIGKGCRLLYASHGSFISSAAPDAQETTNSGSSGDSKQRLPTERGGGPGEKKLYSIEQGKNGPRVRDTVLILFPDGKIATVAVPFPALVRLADPTSFDTHLMKKLPLAIQSGESDMILQVIQCVKSSQSLKKAVDVLIDAYPAQNISSQFLLELLNTALSRLHPKSDNPTLVSLCQYLSGVRQLVRFIAGLQSLSVSETTPHFTVNKLHQCLSDMCGLSSQLAKSTADILYSYFTSFTPQRRVIKEMELKSIVKCFKLPSKIGNVLITSSSTTAGHLDEATAMTHSQQSISEPELMEGGSVSRSDSISDSVLRLGLKDGLSNSSLLDLGCTLFLPLLVRSSPSADINSLFSQSGLLSTVCLSLLSRALLNGNLLETNPCALLQRLNDIFSAVLRKPLDLLTSTTLRNELLFQCSHTHCAGHALLLALLGQKCVNVSSSIDQEEESMEPGEKWEELESWEPVTAEKEEWIRLIHHLEGLTLLSNAIGQGDMRKLPLAPWTDAPQSQEGEGDQDCSNETEERKLNVGSLRIMLLDEVLKGGVTAAALEEYGPGLVAHCVAKWLTDNKIPAEFIAQLPSDPHDLPDGEYSRVVYQFGPLLRLLPLSLSHQSLLVHCAWQAANAKRYQLALDFVNQLGNLKYLTGTIGLLWHCLCESELVRTIDAIRKGGSVDSTSVEAVSVSRNMFGYLYELSLFDGDLVRKMSSLSDEESLTCKDVLIMSRKPGRLSLLEMVNSFPLLSPTISRTYFELLLQIEVVLHLQRPINVVSFFPTWLRSALKKGAFKSAWQEQVPVQLQQKRTKFLCECIRGLLREPLSSSKMSSTFTSVALKELRRMAPSVSLTHLELAELDDFVFLLSDLWSLDTDGIRVHWVSNLFAAGRDGHGKKIFLAIDDKTKVSPELLSLAGFLYDHMIKTMENKTEELALLAQTPPTLLQWIKKQVSSGIAKSCDHVEPSWRSLSQLVTLLHPYLSSTPNAAAICKDLQTLVSLTQKL